MGTTTPATPSPSTAGLPAVSPLRKEGLSDTPRVAGANRAHVLDAADLDDVRKISANEIELGDYNTMLGGTKINVRHFLLYQIQIASVITSLLTILTFQNLLRAKTLSLSSDGSKRRENVGLCYDIYVDRLETRKQKVTQLPNH